MPNLGAAIWRIILSIELLCFPRCVLNYCYHIYQNLLNFTYAFKCHHQKCMLASLQLAHPVILHDSMLHLTQCGAIAIHYTPLTQRKCVEHFPLAQWRPHITEYHWPTVLTVNDTKLLLLNCFINVYATPFQPSIFINLCVFTSLACKVFSETQLHLQPSLFILQAPVHRSFQFITQWLCSVFCQPHSNYLFLISLNLLSSVHTHTIHHFSTFHFGFNLPTLQSSLLHIEY